MRTNKFMKDLKKVIAEKEQEVAQEWGKVDYSNIFPQSSHSLELIVVADRATVYFDIDVWDTNGANPKEDKIVACETNVHEY